MDKELTIPFPIPVNPGAMIVHKIIVAHGASEACLKWSDDNITGSLAVSYSLDSGEIGVPFHVSLDKSDPVHLFDSHNLSIVLGELDTVHDFTSYLDAKVAAIQKLDMLTFCGEEDLLGHYFVNLDKDTGRHFIGVTDPDINFVMIGEGEWNSFVETAAYRRKKKADEISYFYDELIQKTCQNALDGRLMGNADVWAGPSAIKELAKEPRFMRRALAAKMIEMVGKFPRQPPPLYRTTNFMPSYDPEKGYVFLQLHVADPGDYEGEYRPKKQELLKIACGVARNKFPHLKKIVGIAIDAPVTDGPNSEDFILMDCSDWSEEVRAHFDEVNVHHQFFSSRFTKTTNRTVTEFPRDESERPDSGRKLRKSHKGINRRFQTDRDASCSCGSGKPFRKCHGVR